MSAVAPGRHPLGTLAAAWGIVGVVGLLSYAIVRLGTFALELTQLELSGHHWMLLMASIVFMAYSEGYRGFQRAFAPRTVARARHLLKNPSAVQVILAPLFCMGYFHATRRRLISSYTLTVMIIGLVLVARSLDQPWRGIVDAGVVVGLAWGVVSILVLARHGLSDPHFDVSPELPARTESHDSGQEMNRSRESTGAEPNQASPETRRKRLTRYAWLAAGWVFCAVGFVGIVLPGLPTTGPMLLALACFARGSDRLHKWLLNHPRFGPPLRHWHEHRVIPLRAKVVALSMMAASLVYFGWFAAVPAWGATVVCGLIAVGAIVVIRIPHKIAVEPVRAAGLRPTAEQGSAAATRDD